MSRNYFKTVVVVGLASALCCAGVALAAVSQGYKSTTPLVPGTLVSLDDKTAGTIQPSNPDHLEELVGVVVAADTSLLSVTSGAGDTQVATSGEVSVLVSTINGDIKLGDKITVSPIAGVGMKAQLSTKVVGVAQANFDKSTPGAQTKQIKNKAGVDQTVAFGQVPVLVAVAYYVSGSGNDKTAIPKFLQDLVNAIAGKKVSTLRILIATIVLLFSLASIAVILYGSLRSGITSIGRNPLSQSAVYRSLLNVLIACIGILLVTLGAVYLIVTR